MSGTQQRSTRHVVLAIGVLALVVAIDQFVKWWVVRQLPVNDPQVIIPHQLYLNHVVNAGAAFSFGRGLTWVFTLFAAVMVIVVIAAATRVRRFSWAMCLGLIGGGAAGNLVDRLFRAPGWGSGHVVDFIQVPWFAIFNVADIAISCGVILFVLLVLLSKPFRGAQDATPQDATQ